MGPTRTFVKSEMGSQGWASIQQATLSHDRRPTRLGGGPRSCADWKRSIQTVTLFVPSAPDFRLTKPDMTSVSELRKRSKTNAAWAAIDYDPASPVENRVAA